MSLPSWCPKYDNRKYDSKTGEEVYCICKKPDSGELMVGCDGCDDWFHFSCLKIPEKYRDLVFSFYCPYCAAGITGPALTNGGKLPKTVWKRKCRLPDCYRECDSTTKSKYCSREHGLQYMRETADKLYLPGLNKIGLLRQLLRETKSLEEFKSMGHGRLPEVDLPLSKEQYDRIVHEDQHLQQLIDERDQLISQKFPKLNDEEIQVNTYIEWVNGINEHLSPQSSNQATSNRKKNDLSPSGTESIAPSKIGLVGGLSGYFIGVKRQLNYNPQVLTGWLLTPLLIFHGILMKILPQSSKVDIDFDFVKWLLNKERGSFVRWGLGYGPLIALIGLGTYHIFSGTVQYLHIRNLKTRKRILNFMIILACSGIVGLNRLGSQLVIGMDRYYQPIIKKLLAK